MGLTPSLHPYSSASRHNAYKGHGPYAAPFFINLEEVIKDAMNHLCVAGVSATDRGYRMTGGLSLLRRTVLSWWCSGRTTRLSVAKSLWQGPLAHRFRRRKRPPPPTYKQHPQTRKNEEFRWSEKSYTLGCVLFR